MFFARQAHGARRTHAPLRGIGAARGEEDAEHAFVARSEGGDRDAAEKHAIGIGFHFDARRAVARGVAGDDREAGGERESRIGGAIRVRQRAGEMTLHDHSSARCAAVGTHGENEGHRRVDVGVDHDAQLGGGVDARGRDQCPHREGEAAERCGDE